MVKPRVLVLRAPGTNCDVETAFAFQHVGGLAERIHVNRLRESPSLLGQFQILCLPGGFSYGDDIAAGRILGAQLQHELGRVLEDFHSAEKLILGICNGFQVLIKTGLLLPPDASGPQATLAWNDSGRFQDRWVQTRVDGDRSVFLRGISQMFLPIAHAEGRFVTRTPQILEKLQQNQQLVLRYVIDPRSPFAHNPNGSMGDVAGICDPTGRVLGLMPHPERHMDPTHHPQWTRRTTQPAEGDGCSLFRNAVEYFQ